MSKMATIGIVGAKFQKRHFGISHYGNVPGHNEAFPD